MNPAPSLSSQPMHKPTDRTFLGHPPGLFLLFLVEMWERFSYYGMRGLLVLYLTAAFAAHQLAPGSYSNTLRLQITPAPTPAEEQAKVTPPTTTIEIPLAVTVGDRQGNAILSPLANSTAPLLIQRLIPKPDPAHPGKVVWEPAEGGLASTTFSVAHEQRPDGEPVAFRVTNPTDRGVKLSLKLLRPFPPDELAKLIADSRAKARENAPAGSTPASIAELEAKAEAKARDTDNPNYKVYFKINDGTSVVSTNITPDAKRDPRDDPFEIRVDINRIDSGRSWLKADAGTLYGWYTGMAYLLPILGGLIADKLIGTHRSMIVGALLITLGHVMLGVSGLGSFHMNDTGMSIFVFGLALITIGTGHFKPSVSVMVGQLYAIDDPRREAAFSIFYMGINLGAFACNIVCGWLSVVYGWHIGFGAAAVGMVAGLIFYLIGRPVVLSGVGESTNEFRNKSLVFLPIGIAGAAVVALLFHAGVLSKFDEFFSNQIVFWALIGGALGYACWMVAKQASGDRGPVATIFIYMLFNAVFWFSFEQAGSSLNTFTDELTDRTLSGFGKIPTTQFQSLNPLLIILFAPIFGVLWSTMARRNKSIAQPFKIGLGLIFVSLGYVVMMLAAMRLNTGLSKVSMVYICGTYFLHTVGEIILSPTGLSYVAKTAPRNAVSSLMGIWFISSFIANLAAGKVSSLVDEITEGKITFPWHFGGQADFYFLFVVTSLGAGVLILLLGFLLVKLQRTPRD